MVTDETRLRARIQGGDGKKEEWAGREEYKEKGGKEVIQVKKGRCRGSEEGRMDGGSVG